MPKIKVKGQTVQKLERPQMDGRYQTYNLPCFAVDNQLAFDLLCVFVSNQGGAYGHKPRTEHGRSRLI